MRIEPITVMCYGGPNHKEIVTVNRGHFMMLRPLENLVEAICDSLTGRARMPDVHHEEYRIELIHNQTGYLGCVAIHKSLWGEPFRSAAFQDLEESMLTKEHPRTILTTCSPPSHSGNAATPTAGGVANEMER